MPTLLFHAAIAATAVALRLCLPESVRVSLADLPSRTIDGRTFPRSNGGFHSADDSMAKR